MIRQAEATDFAAICAVINDGASAYEGVIPDDRWHEPYMTEAELRAEIAAGIEFSCCIDGDQVVGVMGIQDMGPGLCRFGTRTCARYCADRASERSCCQP